MIKIALIGGAGCGKSGQCAHFFSSLKYDSIPVEQIQEWVREAFNKNLIPFPSENPWVEEYIYREQKDKEDCIPSEIKYMITDSPTMLSFIYTLQYAKLPKDKYLLEKMYEYFLNDISRYDYIFLCVREKEYNKDGTRTQTKEEVIYLDNKIINLLELYNIKYYKITGTPEERTKTMRKIIGV